ncbi:MAG: nickel-dependent lactate racemase [Desulfobacterota bacterium]|nr:nickel-dependent lactate racemase [Thermodesulfobacteriota bacterium]
MDDLFINYRGRRHSFHLPPGWRLLTFADFEARETVPDIRLLVGKALQEPVGTPPLPSLAGPRVRVAVIVEDLTRASPKKIILETILETLRGCGVPEERSVIVLALGTHRGLTKAEIEATFGPEMPARYEFLNHDCLAADLVPAGSLKNGFPVKFNRRVMEADIRIGVGSIFPHPMNGFGGGGKILFPGVADFEAIKEHHFHYTFQEGTALGRLDGNPFHEEVCALARAVPLHFIVNGILDQNDALAGVVAGDPIEAHRAGVEICRSLTTRTFDRQADITLTTSFPYREGPQIIKPLIPVSRITRPGGSVILAADCDGTLPEPFIASFERFRKDYGQDLFEGVRDHFAQRRLIMEEGAVDYNMALAFTLAAQHQFRIILVAEDIPRRTAERMGFLYAPNLEEAFALCRDRGAPPEVHVIPSGGVILPQLINN